MCTMGARDMPMYVSLLGKHVGKQLESTIGVVCAYVRGCLLSLRIRVIVVVVVVVCFVFHRLVSAAVLPAAAAGVLDRCSRSEGFLALTSAVRSARRCAVWPRRAFITL